MTQRKIQYWVIPPQADAEFVAHMEQVLDLYQKPYDPNCPVVCMDEQPVQLVKETRPPMAATKLRDPLIFSYEQIEQNPPFHIRNVGKVRTLN